MFNILDMMIVLNHSSISSLFMTVLIVFGSVLTTLSYVAWKRYHHYENGSNFIDKNQRDE